MCFICTGFTMINFFFFKQKTAYEMRISDWSSDVCSSDLVEREAYYTVLVETDRAYLSRGGKRLPIVPGMICDVEIITGSKSVLSYLLKPISRALNESLTER